VILRAGFDLGTFSILFDRTTAQSTLNPTSISVAVGAGRYSLPVHLHHVSQLQTEREKQTFVDIVAAIWHEKRHFFDVVLSNFGALRTRHYFQVIGYAKELIDVLLSARAPLLVPIEIYACPVRRRLLHAGPVPELAEKLAAAVSARQELFLVDSSPWRGLELGGDAQFEALAFYSQLAAIQSGFGISILRGWQHGLSALGAWRSRYRWLEHLAAAFGIDLWIDTGAADMRALDLPLVGPLLTASLMVRAYNQEDSTGETARTPKIRLLRLCDEIGKSHLPAPGKRDTLAMWSLLNSIAKKLWGRSISEELTIDYQMEETYIRELENDHHYHPDACIAYRDIHQLRAGLIELLEKEPAKTLDTIPWSNYILPRLDPLFVELFPAGMTKSAAPGGDASSDVFWAGTYPRQSVRQDSLTLRRDDIWKRIHAGASPLAKLLLSGRCDPWMIGPEQERFERDLGALGLLPRVDPSLSWPNVEASDPLFHLNHSAFLECRACGTRVPSGGGKLASAWTIRKHPAAARLQVSSAAREADWSSWLLCDRCVSLVATW
jgi:hypothetical protein